MSEWALLKNVGSGFEADIIVERLRSSGIPAQARGKDIVGVFGPGFQGTTARGVDVLVPSSMIGKARELLEIDADTDH